MSRFGLTAKVDTQKQVVNVNPVNNINVNVRSPSDIQNGSGSGKELHSRDQGMAEANSFISLSGYELPLAVPLFHIHHCPFELTTWPIPSDLCTQWLDKVAVGKGEEWKKIEIFDMILLSKKEIPPTLACCMTSSAFGIHQ